jgi:dynein heavy chain
LPNTCAPPHTFIALRLTSLWQVAEWRAIYADPEPHTKPLPAPWQTKLSPFQRMLVLRCLRPDKIVLAVNQFIIGQMGKQYVEPPPLELAQAYSDSSSTMPLIFVLSPGADPMAMLLSFAERKAMEAKMTTISLGQGQGGRAEAMIESALRKGHWVRGCQEELTVDLVSDAGL